MHSRGKTHLDLHGVSTATKTLQYDKKSGRIMQDHSSFGGHP